jgi:hypothetical protein
MEWPAARTFTWPPAKTTNWPLTPLRVTNTKEQPLVMIAATGWLQQLLATPESDTVPRRHQVLEEIWALLGNPHVARYYQACQKLSRTYGVANIAVAHRLEDLTAQTDNGTAAAKIGAGLIADTQTAVLFGQPPAQAREAGEVFGLSSGATSRLATLGRGEALWKVGDTIAAIGHVLSRNERHLSDTDTNIKTRVSEWPSSTGPSRSSPTVKICGQSSESLL